MLHSGVQQYNHVNHGFFFWVLINFTADNTGSKTGAIFNIENLCQFLRSKIGVDFRLRKHTWLKKLTTMLLLRHSFYYSFLYCKSKQKEKKRHQNVFTSILYYLPTCQMKTTTLPQTEHVPRPKTHWVKHWCWFLKSKIGTDFWNICQSKTTLICNPKIDSRFLTSYRRRKVDFREACDWQEQFWLKFIAFVLLVCSLHSSDFV